MIRADDIMDYAVGICLYLSGLVIHSLGEINIAIIPTTISSISIGWKMKTAWVEFLQKLENRGKPNGLTNTNTN